MFGRVVLSVPLTVAAMLVLAGGPVLQAHADQPAATVAVTYVLQSPAQTPFASAQVLTVLTFLTYVSSGQLDGAYALYSPTQQAHTPRLGFLHGFAGVQGISIDAVRDDGSLTNRVVVDLTEILATTGQPIVRKLTGSFTLVADPGGPFGYLIDQAEVGAAS